MMSDVFQNGMRGVEKMGKMGKKKAKKALEGDIAISGRIADCHGRPLCKMRREISVRMPIILVVLLSFAALLMLFCALLHKTLRKGRRLLSKDVENGGQDAQCEHCG